MDINETVLNVGAISFELGLPLVLIIICVIKPRRRRVAISILGAVTPLLCVYAYVTAGYFLVSKEDYLFGFGAMWVMSFFIYCLLVLVGIIIGVIYPTRLTNYIRYGIGVVVGPLIAWSFIRLEQI